MTKASSLDITHQEDNGLHVLHLAGRLDTINSPHAEIRILEVIEKGDKIVVNLKDMDFISSAGLRLILVFMKRSRKKNARIVFCAPTKSVMQIFEMSNFLEFLEISLSVEEAVLKLRS